MALAATEVILGVPLSLYFLITNALMFPYDDWAPRSVVHEHINSHVVSSQEEIRGDRGLKMSLDFNRWSIPGCAFLFFMYCGLSSEALRQYKAAGEKAFSVFRIPFSRSKIVQTNREDDGMTNASQGESCSFAAA
ncbi:STE3-type pheromone receptor [Ceratobasidium sp. AG-Ba]|nr:STE3-type pheromone receptor [Ceratobasidium sp. AG-Ba]